MGCFGNGSGGDCLWIIILIILLCCCCGNNNNDNCGCGCDHDHEDFGKMSLVLEDNREVICDVLGIQPGKLLDED